MRTRTWLMTVGLASIAAWSLAGCTTTAGGGGGGGGGGDGPLAVTIDLEDNAAEFAVEADVPTEKTILITLEGLAQQPGQGITGGTFMLEPDTISFEPSGPGKAATAAQTAPFDFQVTGFAFPKDPIGACGDGDQYGPYTVGVDATGQAVAIDPSQLALQPDTIELIDDNNLAICLRVLSPVSGT
ncbi:MAG: hypothetical protein ACYSVY_18585, partial [Planctomycetota bacterium]